MTNEQIVKLFSKNDLFSLLSQNSIDKIISGSSIQKFSLGESVITESEKTENVYFILNGKVRVVSHNNSQKPVTLFLLSAGDLLGIESLFKGERAEYTARASSNIEVLIIPADFLKDVVENTNRIRKQIEIKRDFFDRYKFLRTREIFSNLKFKDALELLPGIEEIVLNDKEKLYTESESRSAIYLVAEGRLRLVKESMDDKLLLFVSQNDIIGESDFSGKEQYFETAFTDGGAKVFRINNSVYEKLSAIDKFIPEFLTSLKDNRQRQYETILASSDDAVPETLASNINFIEYSGGLSQIKVAIGITQNPYLNGIACLETILRYYRVKKSTRKNIEEQLLLKKPDTLISLSRKIEAAGLLTRLVYVNKPQLKGLTFPGIIKWGDEECILILSVSSSEIVLSSPVKGIIKVPAAEFFEKWNKKILTVDFVPDFGGASGDLTKIIGRFLPLLKPFKSLLIGLAVLSLFLQLIGMVTPVFSEVIIDKVLVLRDKSLLYVMLLGMLIVTAFQLVGSTLRTYIVAHAVRRVSATMQFRFLKHILQLPQKIFVKWQVGDFTTRFQENDKVLQLVSQNGFKIIIDSVTILIYLIIIFSANSTLAGYSLLFVGGYAALIFFSSPILRKNDINVFNAVKDTESFIIETVGNITTVKSMAAEKIFYGDGMKKFIHSKLTSFKGAMFAYNISTISSILNQASVILILGMGAKMVLEGEMTTGELIFFNMTLGLLMAPLNSLVGMWDEIQELRVSFERLNDVLEEETEPVNNMIITEPLKGNIKIEELSFKYEGTEKYSLEKINLDIVAGQKIALVGRSGSGKTTLVNLLMKMYEPADGKIYYDSRDISEVDNSSLRNQIGFVEQSPFLFNGSLKENLIKSNENISYKKMVEISKQAGVDEFVSLMPMQYETQIGEKGVTLSGGQRQRIIIARALMNNPHILILDEATSALDTETERIIQQNLDTIMKDRTTIIVAHRLSTIKNADKIVVMDNGKIVETGTHDELIELGGLYYYLIHKSGS